MCVVLCLPNFLFVCLFACLLETEKASRKKNIKRGTTLPRPRPSGKSIKSFAFFSFEHMHQRGIFTVVLSIDSNFSCSLSFFLSETASGTRGRGRCRPIIYSNNNNSKNLSLPLSIRVNHQFFFIFLSLSLS